MFVCAACGQPGNPNELTISGSALGTEAEVLRRQIARFQEQYGVPVRIRVTPDAADQRHQLYVQWLNARAEQPDVLQLDVIWTPEFAAAGWILPLDRFRPPADSFFPATITANRWQGRLYALPWFVDVGMLYRRRDLVPEAPATFAQLDSGAQAGRRAGLPYGFVWQGARYEGLVTVFLEYLGGFGGRVFDDAGRVVIDSQAAVNALRALRAAIYESGISPAAVLSWQEEQTRFAFQNGSAVFMRNWPYAYALMADTAASRVAGRYAVSPMPAAPGGASTATLGGAQLAINAHTRHAESAYALIAYLTAPAQMLERARIVGQFPARPALFEDPQLTRALAIPATSARAVLERATPRPVTPVYTELSGILQIRLHRALTRQEEPEVALQGAAREIRALLARTGLGGE